MKVKIKHKLWTKPRPKRTCFICYIIPLFRVMFFKYTDADKEALELKRAHISVPVVTSEFTILTGLLFWVYEINVTTFK